MTRQESEKAESIEPTLRHPDLVATVLRDNKQQIIHVWEERTRQQVTVAQSLDTHILLDSLPKMLDDLAHQLEHDEKNYTHIRLQKTGEAHGAQRITLTDFTLSQVIREYGILREVIFEVVESGGVVLAPRAREIILRSIEIGIKNAASAYAEVQVNAEKLQKTSAQTSEAIIQTLLESAPVGMALLDRDLRYIRVNPVLARMNGKPIEEHIGHTVRDVIGKAADDLEPLLKKIVATGEPVLNLEVSATLSTNPNHLVYILANFYPVRTPSGEIIGVGAAVTDITEQKLYENELKDSEQFKSSLLESGDDCFKILDLEGHLTFIADKSREHLELPRDKDVIGADWITFWSRPEDQLAAVKAIREAKAGRRGHFVGYYPTPSKKKLWWDVAISPMKDKKGKVVSLLAVSRDVTGVRQIEEAVNQSERRLRIVSDASPSPIALVDKQKRYKFVNRAYAELYGRKVSELSGLKMEEVISKHTYQQVLPHIEEALGGKSTSFEVDSIAATGANHHFTVSYAPIKGQAEEITGFVLTATNVDELKRVETELKQSEQQARALANSIPQLAWMAHPDGSIFWYNDRWYDYTGTTFEQMEGWGWQAVHDPKLVDKVTAKFEDHIKSGTAWEDTFPLKGKNGEWRWFLSRARPIKDEDGKIVRWFGTNTDVTENREIQKKLEESQARYAFALSAGKIGVWEMEIHSPEVTWSSRQFEIFGIDPATKPLTYDLFLSAIHPDDVPKVNEEYKRCVAEKRDFKLQYRVVHPDQSVHWIDARGRIYYDDAGQPSRMLGTNIDITEQIETAANLKQISDRFRLLAEAIPQIVWTADADGSKNYFNSRWKEYSGLSMEQSIGFGWLECIHPDDRIDWGEAFKHVGQQGYVSKEQRIRRNDGKYRWHLTRGVAMRDEAGRVVQIFGTSTDIEEIKTIQRKLEEAHELRDRFTSALTHDLRTPLTSAKMFAQICLRNGETENRNRFLHKIVESLERADHMIIDLLDANRIRSGERLPLEFVPCSVSKILQEVVDEQVLFRGPRVHLASVDNIEGYWDCGGIRRIVENLVNNAFKYGSPDTPITVAAKLSDNDHVQISVHNFGGEISEDEAKTLFKMYVRTSSAKTSGKKGWGIGLTLVKGLVEAHHGKVWVTSKAGEGTTFTVELPLDSREPAADTK